MFARIPGHTCAHGNADFLGQNIPLRSPGPLGNCDAADPNMPGPIGDTPGPLGNGDFFEEQLDDELTWLTNRRATMTTRVVDQDLNIDLLKEQIATYADVGRDSHSGIVFWDADGRPTVGIGYHIDRPDAQTRLLNLGFTLERIKKGEPKLTEEEIQKLFDEDVTYAVNQAKKLLPTLSQLPPLQQRALVDLLFRLGPDRLSKMKKLLSALEAGDFDKAAEEIRNTSWYKQAKEQGRALVQMLQSRSDRAPLSETIPLRLKRTSLPMGLGWTSRITPGGSSSS